MISNIHIIKFMFSKKYDIMDDALQSHNEYPIIEINSANDLLDLFMTLDAGVLIVSLETRNDLIQIATFMKLAKKLTKDKAMKVVVINFSGSKTFELAIGKIGILDIVQADINAKAFKFKLDFWLRSFKAQLKATAPVIKNKKVETDLKNDNSSNTSSILWQSPLDLEDDIWIIEHEHDCRKILTKWLVSVQGPSPYAGDWNEIKKNHWKFEITHPNKDLFLSGKGDWYFTGETRPDFSWQGNTWLFSGEQINLFFQHESFIVNRLQTKEKTLSISQNSLFAKTKQEIIRETFNKDIYLKSKADRLKNLSGDTTTDHLNREALSGRAGTDKIKNENLSGSVWGKEVARKGNETMTQSASQESSYLEGKILGLSNNPNDNTGSSLTKDDHRSGENLEMDQSDVNHEKYYKNHNLASTFGGHQWNEQTKNKDTDNSGNPFIDINKEDTDQKNNKFSNHKKDSSLNKASESNLESITNDLKVICFLRQNNVQLQCTLDDSFDGNIIFISKENSLINNRTVNMNMNFKSGTKDTFLNISGTITSIEGDGEESYYINVLVTKEDSKSFASFFRLYTLRQSNVNEFLKFAKGV